MQTYITQKIIKEKKAQLQETEDFIAIEKKLNIFLDGKDVVSLYCTPSLVKELVIGFLMTEELLTGQVCPESIIISDGEDITASVIADADVTHSRMIRTSGCAGGITVDSKKNLRKISDAFTIDRETLKNLFSEFSQKSELFRITGCVHSAALSDGDILSVFAEDIGRHNAVDKVIGYALLQEIPLKEKILLVSGRISSEIVTKCITWGISVIASKTATTSLAVDLAHEYGLTLAGFVRRNRLNIYTCRERIY